MKTYKITEKDIQQLKESLCTHTDSDWLPLLKVDKWFGLIKEEKL